MRFTSIDWLIVACYLAGTLAAGLYGKRYISGLADYLVAGRELGTFIGIATLAATEIGTVTFMFYAQLGYATGFASFVNGVISCAMMTLVGRTGIIVRRLRRMKLMTVPEFFEVRYSRRLRILTGVLVATGGILNMGIFLKLEATFLATISGISLGHMKVVMIGILLLEVTYSVLGGMVSIVITDFIQFVAVSLGAILVTLYSVHVVGWSTMFVKVRSTMGVQGFNPVANSHYGWDYIAFQCLLSLATYTCWQTTAMRTFSTDDPETSRKLFSWSAFIYLGRGMMPMVWGIAALAYLGAGQNSLEAMPRFVGSILPPVALGLVVAGMLAATMSSNSSYLLGWSSIIAQDVVIPLRRRPLSARGQVLLNRAANAFVSLFILFWSLWYTLPGPAYFYLLITASIFLSGAFAAILAGIYWTHANIAGAYCALLGGALGPAAYFFLGIPVRYSGLASFVLAAVGMLGGSRIGELVSGTLNA